MPIIIIAAVDSRGGPLDPLPPTPAAIPPHRRRRRRRSLRCLSRYIPGASTVAPSILSDACASPGEFAFVDCWLGGGKSCSISLRFRWISRGREKMLVAPMELAGKSE